MALAVAEGIIRSRQPGATRTYVYFVQSVEGGPIKIGHACNLDSRLSALQSGNPTDLRVLAAFVADEDTEDALHDLLRSVCVRGEWFHPVSDLVELIANIGEGNETAELLRMAVGCVS